MIIFSYLSEIFINNPDFSKHFAIYIMKISSIIEIVFVTDYRNIYTPSLFNGYIYTL